MRDYYDTQQVRLNGHQITANYKSNSTPRSKLRDIF